MLDVLGVAAQAVVIVSFFAFLAERLVERLVKPFVPQGVKEPVAVFSTLALGILGAVAFQLDIINQLLVAGGIGEPLNRWVSIVTTGLIIGSGSQLVHDLWPGSTAKTKPYIMGLQDAWADEELTPRSVLVAMTETGEEPEVTDALKGMSSFRKKPKKDEPETLGGMSAFRKKPKKDGE